MPLSNNLKRLYVPEIARAILDLHALQDHAFASPLHRYVGWGIQADGCFLAAPLKMLEPAFPMPQMDADEGWLAVMQAMHRMFLGTLHSTIDAALQEICTVDGASFLSARDKLKAQIEGVEMSAAKRRKILGLTNSQPGFGDYMEYVLKTHLPANRRGYWRAFLRGLSIARNQASHHSPPTLGKHEQDLLAAADMAFLIRRGEFVISPQRYAPIIDRTLRFFDEIMAHSPGLIAAID
jgi:hypothetical protein